MSTKSKDNVKYVFKNNSSIDILAARQSSRGQRRTGRNKKIFSLGSFLFNNKYTTDVICLHYQGVRDRKSYLDMIWIYNKTHNS